MTLARPSREACRPQLLRLVVAMLLAVAFPARAQLTTALAVRSLPPEEASEAAVTEGGR